MRLFLSLFFCLFCCLSAQAQTDPDEALYLERYARAEEARKTRNFMSIYDVLARVEGAKRLRELPAADGQPIAKTTLDDARAYVAKRNTKAFIIVKDGEVVLADYFGETDAYTPLVAKSLAKPLAVIAVGRALEKGFIPSLNEPAATYFEPWRGTPKEAITVYHLLSMRSGLKRQSRYTGPEDVMRKAYLHPRHDEIIIAEYPLTHTPGTRYDYSNANGDLIAPLITRATGGRYYHWISNEILGPLSAAGGSIWLNRRGGMAHSGCCILLPAMTWVKLAMLVEQEGVWNGKQLLSRSFVEAMRTPTPENPFVGMAVYNGKNYAKYRGATNPDLGGGTFHSEPYAADDILLFDGNGNQVIYIIPSQNLIIARFGDTPAKELGWDNAFLPNLIYAAVAK
ncbi:MAG: serine hydrolase domain-containing protein [Pseudomonadota bacterium]